MNLSCAIAFRYYTSLMTSVFDRIINRDLPAKIFYETDEVIVIADHIPKDDVHLLIIPKQVYRNFQEAPSDLLAMLDATVKLIAVKLGLESHFRLLVNNGYGQEVDHLHYHFLSDRGSDRLVFLPTPEQG